MTLIIQGNDKHGFPKGAVKAANQINGISTGDMVKIVQLKGKYVGHYSARVSSINTTTKFLAIKVNNKAISFNSKLATVIQKKDGYQYG